MRSRRSTASIVTWFLFTVLLWMDLFVNASKDENTKNNPNLDNTITQNVEQDVSQQQQSLKRKREQNSHDVMSEELFFHQSPFQSCKKQILSTIFNEWLTIHEILILRNTCKDFQILLFPNHENMVMFRQNFDSKEMENVPLMWIDLKNFLNESYANALKEMVMLNLKENQYAIFTRDKRMIFWPNEQALHVYTKMIFHKLTNEPFFYGPPKIYTNLVESTIWHKITNAGNVIIGGEGKFGVQSPLKNVKIIKSTCGACAALLENDHVVAWGDKNVGGEIPELIQPLLHNAKMIFSNSDAFAVLLEDSSVVAWGRKNWGGNIPEQASLDDPNHVQPYLKNVKTITSTYGAFAALLQNGSVVAWGSKIHGGIIPKSIQTQLHQVKMIYSNNFAFAALLKDGSVLAWGAVAGGGEIPYSIQVQLKNVKTIFSSYSAFAALLNDGSVFAWGQGGEIPNIIQTQLQQNVTMVYSNDHAFVALLKNGNFVAWGHRSYGGLITHEIQTKLKNAKTIFSSSGAFAAILDNGSVFAWGRETHGGKIPDLMNDVKTIFPQKHGFTALYEDGEMISWGKFNWY